MRRLLLYLLIFYNISVLTYPKPTVINSEDDNNLDSLYWEIKGNVSGHWYDDWTYNKFSSLADFIQDPTKYSQNIIISEQLAFSYSRVISISLKNKNITDFPKKLSKFSAVISNNLSNNSISNIARTYPISSITQIVLDFNKLNFTELEFLKNNVMVVNEKVQAHNQDTIKDIHLDRVFYGDTVVLRMIDVGGTPNMLRYQWFSKSRGSISADSTSYTSYKFVLEKPTDTCNYGAKVTNKILGLNNADIPTITNFIRAIPPSPEYDHRGLKALYEALTPKPIWTDTSDNSTFQGVAFAGDLVTEIDLSGNVFQGYIPYNLRYLGALEKFNIGSNKLDSISDAFKYMHLLNNITVSHNKFLFDDLEKLKIVTDRGGVYDAIAQDTVLKASIKFKRNNEFFDLRLNQDSTLSSLDTFKLYIPKIPTNNNIYNWYYKIKGDANFTKFLPSEYIDKSNFQENIFAIKKFISQNRCNEVSFYAEVSNPNVQNTFIYSDTINAIITNPERLDSLALVAIYKSTDGNNWTSKWDLSTPYSSWQGITLKNGRVQKIQLVGLGLKNIIPKEIIWFDSLKCLFLQNNQLDFVNKMRNIKIDSIDISNNQIQNIDSIYPVFPKLKYFHCDRNNLDFRDIEIIDLKYFGKQDFKFFQQNYENTDDGFETNINCFGDSLINKHTDKILYLKYPTIPNGLNNKYIWKNKNKSLFIDTTQSGELVRLGIDTSRFWETAKYKLLVDNDSVNKRYIKENPSLSQRWYFSDTNLTIKLKGRELDSMVLARLYKTTNGSGWSVKTNWLSSSPLNTWFGVVLKNGRIDSLKLANNNLVGYLHESFEGLDSIRYFNFRNNAISKIEQSLSIKRFVKLDSGIFASNYLHFNDFINNVDESKFNNIVYFPQKTLDRDTIELTYTPFTKFSNKQGVKKILNPVDIVRFYRLKPYTDAIDSVYWYKFKKNIVPTKVGVISTTLDSLNYEDTIYYYSKHINTNLKKLIIFSDTIGLRYKTSRYTDSLALVSIYKTTHGDAWTNRTNWLTNNRLDDWKGIILYQNRVVSLTLDNNNLEGFIPERTIWLDSLSDLYLQSNKIDSLTPKILNLYKKDTIDLSGNYMTFKLLDSLKNISKYISSTNNKILGYANQRYVFWDSIFAKLEGKPIVYKGDGLKKRFVDYLCQVDFKVEDIGGLMSDVVQQYKPRYYDTTIYISNLNQPPTFFNTSLDYNCRNVNITFIIKIKNNNYPKLVFVDSALVRAVGTPYTDSIALRTIYNQCDGANWNWALFGGTCKKWNQATISDFNKSVGWCGIKTDTLKLTTDEATTFDRLRVRSILIPNINLKGSLPTQIGLLDAVRNIDLSNNYITYIPPQFRDLGDIRVNATTLYQPQDFYLDSVDVRYNQLRYSSIQNILTHGEFQDSSNLKKPFDLDGNKIDGYLLVSPQKSFPLVFDSTGVLNNNYFSNSNYKHLTIFEDKVYNIPALTKFRLHLIDYLKPQETIRWRCNFIDNKGVSEVKSTILYNTTWGNDTIIPLNYHRDTIQYYASVISNIDITNSTYSTKFIDNLKYEASSTKIKIHFLRNRLTDSLALVAQDNLLTPSAWANRNQALDNWNGIRLTNDGSRVDSVGLKFGNSSKTRFLGNIASEIETLDSMKVFRADSNYFKTVVVTDGRPLSKQIDLKNYSSLKLFNISNNLFNFFNLPWFQNFNSSHDTVVYNPQFKPSLSMKANGKEYHNVDTIMTMPALSNYIILTNSLYKDLLNDTIIGSDENYNWFRDTITKIPTHSYCINEIAGDNGIFKFYAQINDLSYPKLVFNSDTIRMKIVIDRSSDSLALIRFFNNSTLWDKTIVNSGKSSNWATAGNLNNWYGVSVKSTPDGRVDSLKLSGMSICNFLHRTFSVMDSLVFLDASNNYIYGLENDIFKLCRRKKLDSIVIRNDVFHYKTLLKIKDEVFGGDMNRMKDTLKFGIQTPKPIYTISYKTYSTPQTYNMIYRDHSGFTSFTCNFLDAIDFNLDTLNMGQDISSSTITKLGSVSKSFRSNYKDTLKLDEVFDAVKFAYIIRNSQFNYDIKDTVVLYQKGCYRTDTIALKSLYKTTNGPLWNNPNKTIYYTENNRIRIIDASKNNLTGFLPQEMSLLDSLYTLRLDSNRIDSISLKLKLQYIASPNKIALHENNIKNIPIDLFKYNNVLSNTSISRNYFEYDDLEDISFINLIDYSKQKSYETIVGAYKDTILPYNETATLKINMPKGANNETKWKIYVTRNPSPIPINPIDGFNTYISNSNSVNFKMDSLWYKKNIEFFKDTFKIYAIISNTKLDKTWQGADESINSPHDNYFISKIINVTFGKNRLTDSLILLAIKDTNQNGLALNSWQNINPLNIWTGISLNINGRVEKIDLHTGGASYLKDKFPAIIKDLDSLKEINILGNIGFNLKQEIENIKGLKKLNIANSQLDTISFRPWKMLKLEAIDLSSNKLDFYDLLPLIDSLSVLNKKNILNYKNQTTNVIGQPNDTMRRGWQKIMVQHLTGGNKYIIKYGNSRDSISYNGLKGSLLYPKFYWNHPDDTLNIFTYATHDSLRDLEILVRLDPLIDFQGSRAKDSIAIVKLRFNLGISSGDWTEGLKFAFINGEQRVIVIDYSKISNIGLANTVPKNIRDLVKLQTLNLIGKKIISIDTNIKYLYSKLRHIDLTNNNLTDIPYGVHWIDSARYFRIDSNKIINIKNLDQLDSIYKRINNKDSIRLRNNIMNFDALYILYSKLNPVKSLDSNVWIPQDSIGEFRNRVYKGDLGEIKMRTYFGMPVNTFKWSRNGTPFINNDSIYTIPVYGYTESLNGIYNVQAHSNLLGSLNFKPLRLDSAPFLNPIDTSVLKKIYYSTDGKYWYPNDTTKRWNINASETDKSAWYGVETRLGRVVALTLDSAGLSGNMTNDLNKLEYLKGIDFSNNKLLSIALDSLKHLKYVDIDFNKLAILPSIIGTDSLKYFKLSGNSLINKMDSSYFNYSRKTLDTLYLDNCNFTEIPLGVRKLDYTEYINFSGNPNLVKIDNLIGKQFTNLLNLKISQAKINSVSNLNMPNLINLDLNDNEIDIFTFNNLGKLQNLNIAGNKMVVFPNLLLFPRLKELYANSNKFKENINLNGENIEIINVGWNNISSLTLGNLPKLRGLVANNNNISDIIFTGAIVKDSLEKLALHNNKMKNIPVLFKKSSFVTLQNNNLTFCDIRPFKTSNKIEFLYFPQDLIGKDTTIKADTGKVCVLPVDTTLHDTSNIYLWYKYNDKIKIENHKNRNLTFDKFTANFKRYDPGVYYYEVINDSLPLLILRSRLIRLEAKDSTIIKPKDADLEKVDIEKLISVVMASPNPFKYNIKIKYFCSKYSDVLINLYDTKGSLIKEISHKETAKGFETLELDSYYLNISTGIYYLSFISSEQMLTLKIIYIGN